MSNNDLLRFSGQASLSVGAFFQSDVTDKVWDGSAMVDDNAGLTLTRAGTTVIPETGSGTGRYRAKIKDVAANLPVDKYLVTYYDLVGDPGNGVAPGAVVFQETIEWDGVSVVDDLVTGQSVSDICNLALSHLGIGRPIASMDTDATEEATACRQFFNSALEETLRKGSWGFARRFADLGLVEEDPTSEWDFSYRFPTNALKIRRIISGQRNDSQDTRIPCLIAGDDAGRLIFTDQPDAQIEYIAKVSNPLRFTPDFVLAFSCYLAFLIAPRISGANQKFGDRAYQLYLSLLGESETTDANENQPDRSPESEFVTGRE